MIQREKEEDASRIQDRLIDSGRTTKGGGREEERKKLIHRERRLLETRRHKTDR
jgi:hypothetical protein